MKAVDIEAARRLVHEELAKFLARQRAATVTPTVVALRQKADAVVEAEIARLDRRLPQLAPAVRNEIIKSIHRTADKLMHPPTVAVRHGGGVGRSRYARGRLRGRAADPVRARGRFVTHVRLGARRSPLAVVQAEWIAARLVSAGHEVELVGIDSHGDRDRRALTEIGGTGVFAAAVRDALFDGTIDLAVHSLKDLPVAASPGLTLAAVPARGRPPRCRSRASPRPVGRRDGHRHGVATSGTPTGRAGRPA